MRRLLFGFLQVLFCCQTLIFSENLCFSFLVKQQEIFHAAPAKECL